MTLPEALKKYRANLGLCQKEVANKLGITREYYSLIEEGKRQPSSILQKKIEECLGIQVSYSLHKHS